MVRQPGGGLTKPPVVDDNDSDNNTEDNIKDNGDDDDVPATKGRLTHEMRKMMSLEATTNLLSTSSSSSSPSPSSSSLSASL